MEVDHLTTNSTMHSLQTGINNRVEPLVSDHPKCEELLVAYRKCLLARVELQEIFKKEKSRCVYFLEWMYCMQFLGYNNMNPCCFWSFLILWVTIIHTQEGYYGFQVTGMIEWGQKSKPKKIPRAFDKTPKTRRPKINPRKIPCWISEP